MSNLLNSSLSVDDLARVRPLLERAPQKPLRFLGRDPGCDLVSFWMQDLQAMLQGSQGAIFVVERDGRVAGMAACGDLPWESRVFGRRMGALKHLAVDPDSSASAGIAGKLLGQVAGWALARGLEFLLCKAYSDDVRTIHSLEADGFLLMDTMLDYVCDLREHPLARVPPPPVPPGFTIRTAGKSDEDGLAAVAQAAFLQHFGRFHSDERISRQQATDVYVEWIRSSCRGYADWILVAETEGRLAGYSAWKKPSALEQAAKLPIGHYSIGAIHPDFYGCGLFSVLTHGGMRLLDGTARYIEGPTHLNNYPAQRGYDRLSWRVRDARHSFHKWLVAG